jgi:hypothetical protein
MLRPAYLFQTLGKTALVPVPGTLVPQVVEMMPDSIVLCL